MSQADLKKIQHIKKKSRTFGCSRAFLGFVFFGIVLSALFIGVYETIDRVKHTYSSPFSKLLLIGELVFTTQKDIEKAILATGMAHSFMEEDVSLLQEEIKRLPWVKQVSVRKHWPDKLEIFLRDYVPIARWNDLYLLDGEGKIFSAPEHRMKDKKLVLLYGPEGREQDILASYRAMNQLLSEHELHLKMAKMNARHSWQLVLDNEIRLEVGKMDMMPRLMRLIELYPFLQNRPDERINYIDLRYKNGAAVNWYQ